MYSVISFLAWGMFGWVTLIFLAELADMIAQIFRRSAASPAVVQGSFNLRPHESTLQARHSHTTSTSGGSWGGLNKFD